MKCPVCLYTKEHYKGQHEEAVRDWQDSQPHRKGEKWFMWVGTIVSEDGTERCSLYRCPECNSVQAFIGGAGAY